MFCTKEPPFLCIHVLVGDESLRFATTKIIPRPISSCTQMQVSFTLLESSPAALCDDPVDIDNGTVMFNGSSVDDMATYTCDLGFELMGNATTTCTLVDKDSAEFQPAPPYCRREFAE